MSRALRVGFIGLGGWAQAAHAPAVKGLEGLVLVACSDVDAGRVKSFREKFGCEGGYIDYREMLEREKPDVVLVAVPHRHHCRVAVDAMEAGAHVYLEKPMSTSLEEALRLVDVARKRERILVVGHVQRLSGALQSARKLVGRGRLGKIYFGKSLILRRRGIPNSPTFTTRDLAGGGAVLDIGSHAVDHLLFPLGYPVPASVVGHTAQAFSEKPHMFSTYPLPTPSPARTEVEDFGYGLLRFDGALVAHVEVSWASYYRDDANEVIIMGDQGGLWADLKGGRLGYASSLDEEFMISEALLHQPREDLTTRAWRLLAEAVSKGMARPPYPLCTPEQGAVIVAVLEAIYRSSSEGAEVRVELPKSVTDSLGW